MQEGKQSTHRIDSKALQNLVLKAFAFQKQRGQTCFNSRLQGVELERHCVLDSTTKETLEIACEKFGISKRGYDKILRVARTIADLESSTKIQKEHLLEALSFRKI